MQIDMVPRDKKFAFKFAQLYIAIRDKFNIKIIEKLVEQQDDINFEISPNSPHRNSRFYLSGCSTVLHLAYHELDDVDFFVSLLKKGANFTIKNEYEQTVLHTMLEKHIPWIHSMQKPLENRFINAVLSAHVTYKNFENPCNNNGLSHFHIACMTTNLTAVKFFLDNGVPVDDPVSVASEHLSGYTPLHLAAIYANTKVAEILLAHGANTHITEASRMTSLHILIKQKLELLDLNRITRVNQRYNKMLQEPIGDHDQFINMLLENTSTDNDCPDNIGLTNFHVACMLQDTSVAQNLVDRVADLDHMVSMDSPLWPGYTALHFAAYANLGTVTMLINKGASTEAKDSKGLTFLDHCVERYTVNDICRIISLKENWKDLLFSDGKTTLLSFIRAMKHQYKCDASDSSIINVNMHIPMESLLWPGYTPLHLAVLFAKGPKEDSGYFYGDWRDVDLRTIKLYLKNGADLSFQDSRGQTALHLAFRLNYTPAVDVILRRCRDIPNLSDEDNLSHLHIVCAMGKKKRLLKKCVIDNSVVNAVYTGESPVNNIRPGSTPLHALVSSSRENLSEMIRILLSYGADSRMKDAQGLTPIHWLLGCSSSDVKDNCEELLDQVVSDCVVEDYGMSYLHVASHLDNPKLAKRLLGNGADVNLAIKRGESDRPSFLGSCDKYTPLHFNSSCGKMCKLLLDHGADVFAEKADGSIPLNEEHVLKHFVWKLQNDADHLQQQMERKLGWTRLHLACYSVVDDGFKNIVEAELKNVNARVFPDSPIWKGYTPLHVLMDRLKNRGISSSKLTMLLENGADVTVVDEKQDSPVTMLFDFSISNNERVFPFREELTLLMNHHKDFSINPVNAQGVSHFHLACYLNNAIAVEEFLSHGADVNRPMGFFADWYSGYTPLHLASKLHVIDLLIRQGADVQIENVQGRTALEKAVEYRVVDEKIVARIIESGADINRPNSRGETAFEVAISDRPITMEQLMFYLKQGFVVNSCNPLTGISYLRKIVEMSYEDEDLHKLIAEKIINEVPSLTLGRTTLHHLVTSQSIRAPGYVDLFRKLIKSSQDIDQQDNEGKTALHLAAEFKSAIAVLELLNYGADINVCDINGNSPLSDPTRKYICIAKILIVHAHRLALLGLDLSKINVDIANPQEGVRDLKSCGINFYEQITASKDVKLEVRSLRLYDFLSETGAVTLYPFLNQLERCKIEQYLESIDNEKSWNRIRCFLKLQYRKAVKRLELFPMATNCFKILLGFDLPDLCIENIFQYLPNSALQNIISADIEMEDTNMDVD